MGYKQINKYTWVLCENGKSLPNTEAPQKKIEKVLVPRDRNTELYKDFCKEVFRDRKFICIRAFNRLIEKEFNRNTTYYRGRMVALKFISIKKGIIKPGEKI
ncbi:hypothetical protein [Bergeyella zoohelcum]|uniref:hypothetical protein n=1 Tax=Bergeyella zoohelcum TaxID=1015 RepID=UPI0002F19FB7|nr:hypothetical protein [Bergeyella zoohelcum]